MTKRHAILAPLVLVCVAIIAIGTLVASVLVMVAKAIAEGVQWMIRTG